MCFNEIVAIVKKHIDKLDYYNLLAEGAPSDEFDMEILEISRAINFDSSVSEIAKIIARVFKNNFSEATPVKFFIQTATDIKSDFENKWK